MPAASLYGRDRHENADVAQPASGNTGSQVSLNTAMLPSIEEAMMDGGYDFGGSQTSLFDVAADTEVLHSSDSPLATTTMADTAPLLPPVLPHPVAASVVKPPHKDSASLFSPTGTTPTPSNSNPNSTDTTPVAAQSHQHHRCSASLHDAQQQRIANSSTRAASTPPSNRLSAPPPAAPAVAAAAASMTSLRHRVPPATTTSAAAAVTASSRRPAPQPLNPADSSVLSRQLLSADHSVDYTSPHAHSNKAENQHPAPPPADAGSAANPNSRARRRYTVATTRTAPPPSLSPQKENYSSMRRVTVTPQTSPVAAAAAAANGATSADGVARGPVSSLLASRLLGPNSSRNSSVTAAAAVPGSTPNSNSVTLSATMPTNALTSPGTLAAPALRPHPPAGSPSNLLVSAATSPGTSPSRRARLTPSRHATPNKSIEVSQGNSQGETASPADEEASAPSESVPLWLVQLNNVLMKQNTKNDSSAVAVTQQASSSLEESAPHADLAHHRTFSQAVTSSAEDWLNPCNRPKGLTTHSPFYATQMHAQDQQSAANAAGLPPGVTAALHVQYMREEMGSGSYSQTSQTDTNTNTDSSCGTPKTGSISNSDVIPSGSNNIAHFVGGRWRAEDGAQVCRQYPSRSPSLAGNVACAESGGLIPISREQRTMSPQSQWWESSGCISLNSSVAESALRQQSGGGAAAAAAAVPAAPSVVAAPANAAAPVDLVRREASISVASRGSEDIMAPVRLGGHDGATTHASLLSASAATMTTAAEMLQLAEVKSEPLVMPPMARAFSLQPALCSGEDLSLHMREPAGPQRDVLSTGSAPGSASVLSTNEGPSSMRLPLARFMRNASSGSPMNGPGHLQQQQQPRAHVQPPSPSTGGRRGVPAVLSLRPESPPINSPRAKDAAPHNSVGGSGERRVASWGQQSPHQQQQQQQQPLRQGQVQTLDEDLYYTSSLTLTPPDAFLSASRATSALSLAVETNFVRYD